MAEDGSDTGSYFCWRPKLKHMPSKNQKKFYILIIVLAIAFVIIWQWSKGKTNKVKIKEEAVKAPLINVVSVDYDKLPKQFAADFPVEKEGIVEENYQADIGSGGQKQSTRRFVSKRSIDENFEMYKQYLEKKGWQATESVNEPDNKVLFAIKGEEKLQAAVTKNSQSNEVRVTASLTYYEILK